MRASIVISMMALGTLILHAQWQPVGLGRGNVIGFAETSEGVFCAVRGAGVYLATDASFQWQVVRDGLSDVDLLSITDDGVGGLLLITATGLWHRTPTAPWTRVDDPAFSGATLRFIKRVTAADIYLSGRDGRCFLSRNNGNTWKEVGRITTDPYREVTDFAVASDGTVWAAGVDLYSSSDHGETWVVSNYQEQTGRGATSIAIGKTMTVVVGSKASYSTDNMTTWKEVGNANTLWDLNGIVEHNGFFYIGGEQDVLSISANNPTITWASNLGFSVYTGAEVQCVFVTSRRVLLAGINMHGVYVNTTAGWEQQNDGINGMSVSKFGVSPRGALLFADENGDLYRSFAGDSTVKLLNGGYTGFIGIIQKHRDGRMIYGFHQDPPRGKSYDFLYYSDDDGRTRERLSQAFLPGTEDYYGTPDWATSVGMMDSNSDSVVFGFTAFPHYGSSVGSKQLTKLTNGSKINTYRTWFGTDYLVGGNPIHYFDVSDSTWRTSTYEGEAIRLGAMDRSESGAFYAVSTSGLLKSLDQARTFFKVTSEFDGLRLNELIVLNDRRLVVADSNDIYATNDGGISWRRINRNLPPSKIEAIDADLDGNLYVAFRGAGIWKCPWEEATTTIQEDIVGSTTNEQLGVAVYDVRGNRYDGELTTGLYFIVVRDHSGVTTRKIVVVR